MTTRRIARITRRSAARALDQTGTSGAAGVDELLSAATAPASTSELSREGAQVAMFRQTQTHRAAVAAAARPTAAQSTRKRLGAGKFVVAGATALALSTGGVALAASTGHLPFGGDHRSATGALHSSEAPGQSSTDSTHPAHPTNGPTGHASASPSPSLTGLCHAFQAGAGSSHGKNLDNPAFTALATAAGGKANMAAYCTALIGAPGTHPSATTTHPAKPTQAATPTHPAKPTQAATPTHSPHPTPTHPAHPTKSPSPHS